MASNALRGHLGAFGGPLGALKHLCDLVSPQKVRQRPVKATKGQSKSLKLHRWPPKAPKGPKMAFEGRKKPTKGLQKSANPKCLQRETGDSVIGYLASLAPGPRPPKRGGDGVVVDNSTRDRKVPGSNPGPILGLLRPPNVFQSGVEMV